MSEIKNIRQKSIHIINNVIDFKLTQSGVDYSLSNGDFYTELIHRNHVWFSIYKGEDLTKFKPHFTDKYVTKFLNDFTSSPSNFLFENKDNLTGENHINLSEKSKYTSIMVIHIDDNSLILFLHPSLEVSK